MVSTYYHGCQFHALTATRTGSPTGVGVVGLSHLPRYGQVAKLVLPCLGNSCDICRHTARRIASKEKGRYLRWARGGIHQQGFRDCHGYTPRSKVVGRGKTDSLSLRFTDLPKAA